MKKSFYSAFCIPILFLLFSSMVHAQKNKIEGIWYNQEKTAKIEVFKDAKNKFWGKIVWLKEPLENGKPKLDKNNSDKKKQSEPLIGLFVLKGFEQVGDNNYENGTIYDPKNGKTYNCNITYKSANLLNIRGYIGISLFGRTAVWTR